MSTPTTVDTQQLWLWAACIPCWKPASLSLSRATPRHYLLSLSFRLLPPLVHLLSLPLLLFLLPLVLALPLLLLLHPLGLTLFAPLTVLRRHCCRPRLCSLEPGASLGRTLSETLKRPVHFFTNWSHTFLDARGSLRILVGRCTRGALCPESLCCPMLRGEGPWQQRTIVSWHMSTFTFVAASGKYWPVSMKLQARPCHVQDRIPGNLCRWFSSRVQMGGRSWLTWSTEQFFMGAQWVIPKASRQHRFSQNPGWKTRSDLRSLSPRPPWKCFSLCLISAFRNVCVGIVPTHTASMPYSWKVVQRRRGKPGTRKVLSVETPL